VLATIAVLLTALAAPTDDRRRTLLTGVALTAVLAGVGALWSKLFLLCTAACALAFVARAVAWRYRLRVRRPWLIAAAGVLLLVLLMAWLYTLQGWRFKTSTMVRLELWGMAADLASSSFPWGIGLGQFGAWLGSIHYQLGEVYPIRFVHNQFLAFVTEAGAAGIALCLIIVKLVIDAATAWRGIIAAIFFGIVLGALTLHDGIGLRAVQVLVGYTFAVSVRPKPGGTERYRLS
jgi:hypothetical protein